MLSEKGSSEPDPSEHQTAPQSVVRPILEVVKVLAIRYGEFSEEGDVGYDVTFKQSDRKKILLTYFCETEYEFNSGSIIVSDYHLDESTNQLYAVDTTYELDPEDADVPIAKEQVVLCVKDMDDVGFEADECDLFAEELREESVGLPIVNAVEAAQLIKILKSIRPSRHLITEDK